MSKSIPIADEIARLDKQIAEERRSRRRLPPLDFADIEARHAWGAQMRSILEAVRLLAFDAAAPRGERRQSRRHLRHMLRTHLRAMEARIDAVDPLVRPVEHGEHGDPAGSGGAGPSD